MIYTTEQITQFINKKNFIEETDNMYLAQVKTCAKEIIKDRLTKPIIFVCGPSGACKTTTSYNIDAEVEKYGLKCVYISMDDYFYTLTEEERRTFDLESPLRVDFELLNDHIEKMLSCREVLLPKFDFVSGVRRDNVESFTRTENELIIIEGIHAFNTDYLKYKENSQRLYINILDEVTDGEVTISSAQMRLLRRISRDKKTRGRKIQDTLDNFVKVERGEDKFITPFEKDITQKINTFSMYELSVFKSILYNDLREINEPKLKQILQILEKIPSLSPTIVTDNSSIKEFI